VQFRAITWNLFHGRDFPPDPALLTWRSRLLRISERNAAHVQVNRSLLPEFARMIANAEWDVILLQECPPRYASPLARACEAEGHRVLTSRNQLRPLRTVLALANPDLMASAEGGSNLTLVRRRGPLSPIVERRELTIRERDPERRVMAFTRTSSGVCVANLHATSNVPAYTSAELPAAAEQALTWAGEAPLLFGGDLNLRPAEHPAVFEELRERFGLVPPTAPNSIDHLLSRGLEILEPPSTWAPQRRELTAEGLALRLSDHGPVEAAFALP
jgi:endonuclease/exonuclease/phosphatase family metal-dependent hydrolase